MGNISFQANYIKPVYVRKKDADDNFHPYKTSMVEMDKTSANDRRVLNVLSHGWGRYNFVSDIYFDIERDYFAGRDNSNKHVFAITSQVDDFDNLRADDVLAVAEFIEKKNLNELEYLQVNPDCAYVNPHSCFKNIGSVMLNFLADRFPDKIIKVFPTSTAVASFYKKNSYSVMPEDSRYLWNG